MNHKLLVTLRAKEGRLCYTGKDPLRHGDGKTLLKCLVTDVPAGMSAYYSDKDQ